MKVTDEMVAAACQQMWQEYGYGDGDWQAMHAALEAALATAPQPALEALREDLPELLRTRELELDALREEALQRMADEEGALGVDYTAPDALREACEWVMSCAEEYQQRAHRAERELLALREAARMALEWLVDEQQAADADCGDPSCSDCKVTRARQTRIDALREVLGARA